MISYFSAASKVFDEHIDAQDYARKNRLKFFYGFTIAGHVIQFKTANYKDDPKYVAARTRTTA